ncbi:hypothetical protein MVEG_12415 [Podila verticillata NRRL 6337]|uniref:HIRAN domain-containing protein n=1 Tax=Podila verticillata NRRL 6337 TaxID=1069443 RepID=A0A086TIG8_9FUNG|nr:hypothetical protein MVEG_12415 [Podila verticillata NRRL 6337]
MEYNDIEPEVKRYMRRSTFKDMPEDAQRIYVKGIRRIIRKLSELDNRESYIKIAGKTSEPRPSLEFMVVGMRFRGDHKFSHKDDITLELDDDNRVDKYAIKVLVDGKHVAFVAAEDARKLRKIKDVLDRRVYLVKKYAQSATMRLDTQTMDRMEEYREREADRELARICHREAMLYG